MIKMSGINNYYEFTNQSYYGLYKFVPINLFVTFIHISKEVYAKVYWIFN